MSGLAVLLVGIGLADLVRSVLTRDPVPPGAKGAARALLRRGRVVPATVGVLGVLAAAVVAGLLTTAASAGLVALAAVCVLTWVVLADRALHARSAGHLVALCCLVVAIGAQLLLSGWAAPAGGLLADWLAWARLPWDPAPSADRLLLLAGLVLVQLSTGNVVVRLVLTSIGAMKPERPTAADEPGPQPSDELKGGRLLGPLERVFILGLGLAGQVTAAGMVIAAKGLIRWPELKAKSEEQHTDGRRTSGIDAVTEYFLVGSFVSWLVALVALVAGRA